MSWEAQAWAAKQRAGSASAKLVLMIYASFANERGWAYPSNETVCGISELNTKTVREAIDRLEAIGLLIDTQRRTGRTKQVRVLQLGMESLPKPDTLRDDPDQNGREDGSPPRRTAAAARLPKTDGLKPTDSAAKGSQNWETEPSMEPLPPDGANAPSAPQGAKRERGSRIPANWHAPTIADLPPQAKRVAEQWPRGAYEAEAEAFHGYWLSEGRAGAKKLDWSRAWCNRVVALGAKPIRDGKAGLTFAGTSAGAERATPTSITYVDRTDEDVRAGQVRQAIRETAGRRLFEQWIAPHRFDFDRNVMTVVAVSSFTMRWLRDNYADRLAAEASKASDERIRIEFREARPDELRTWNVSEDGGDLAAGVS